MSDNKKNVGSPDRKLIAMNEEYEVSYWTQALGVSRERLQQLVTQHGNSAEAVRKALKDSAA